MILFLFILLSFDAYLGAADIYPHENGLKLPLDVDIPKGMFAVERLAESFRNQKSISTLSSQSYESIDDLVEFRLYTRNNPYQPEVINIDSFRPLKYFRPELKTKIYVHGWNSGEFSGDPLRQEYLYGQFYDAVNYIEMVHANASSIFYGFLRAKVPALGRRLAQMLVAMSSRHGLKLADVHLIGYSLGAHIAGEAGRQLRGGMIGRITGLDPAGPLFSDPDTPDRLSESTARTVDVIHTCSNLLGLATPMGHVDFYPNNGVAVQPGCFLWDFLGGMCSHRRAFDLYLYTIAKGRVPFIASRCDGSGYEAVMGEYLSAPSIEGTYCLTTGAPPYSPY